MRGGGRYIGVIFENCGESAINCGEIGTTKRTHTKWKKTTPMGACRSPGPSEPGRFHGMHQPHPMSSQVKHTVAVRFMQCLSPGLARPSFPAPFFPLPDPWAPPDGGPRPHQHPDAVALGCSWPLGLKGKSQDLQKIAVQAGRQITVGRAQPVAFCTSPFATPTR